jgi:transcriptional regulator with XRE-family HTH domain
MTSYIRSKLAFLDPEKQKELSEGTIGARIKWVIDELEAAFPGEYSLRKVAKNSSISPQALWAIVNDQTKRPAAETVENICEALELPITWVLLGTVQTVNPTEHEKLAGLPEKYTEFLDNDDNLPYIEAALDAAIRLADHDISPEALQQAVELIISARGLDQ